MVAICALISIPQCIASLFIHIISDMFSFSLELVSNVIISKMIAQSVELHQVFFDNRNYRNYLSSFRIIGRYQFIKNSNATARLSGTRAKDLSLLRCCFITSCLETNVKSYHDDVLRNFHE